MSKKRRWGLWPSRIAGELNGISGVAGVGGTAMGVAAWTALAGAAATTLMTGGATLAVGAVGYAIYTAVPPKLRSPEDVAGKTIDLNELADVDPPILRLAVVGPTRAGKTTLKNRLSFAWVGDCSPIREARIAEAFRRCAPDLRNGIKILNLQDIEWSIAPVILQCSSALGHRARTRRFFYTSIALYMAVAFLALTYAITRQILKF